MHMLGGWENRNYQMCSLRSTDASFHGCRPRQMRLPEQKVIIYYLGKIKRID